LTHLYCETRFISVPACVGIQPSRSSFIVFCLSLYPFSSCLCQYCFVVFSFVYFLVLSVPACVGIRPSRSTLSHSHLSIFLVFVLFCLCWLSDQAGQVSLYFVSVSVLFLLVPVLLCCIFIYFYFLVLSVPACVSIRPCRSTLSHSHLSISLVLVLFCLCWLSKQAGQVSLYFVGLGISSVPACASIAFLYFRLYISLSCLFLLVSIRPSGSVLLLNCTM